MNTINETHFQFSNQKSVYKGKVREVYNINDDWELMLTAQSAFGELNSKFQSMGSGIYLRTMYSF